MTTTTSPTSNTHQPTALFAAARIVVTLAVPILLTVLAVRLVMSPLFLQVEYNRPGFPADVYGFTTEQRLEYARPAIDYLLNPFAGISFLEDLRLPREQVPADICVSAPEDDALCYMYNARELRHMEDVHVVTQYTYVLGIVALALGTLSTAYLWRRNRPELRVGLFTGAVLTLGIIGTIILLALTAWETFFTGFHSIFFEGDSWLFRYSDTLIRLFPEQFWFDAALLIGVLVTLGALLILALTRWRAGWFYPAQPHQPTA